MKMFSFHDYDRVERTVPLSQIESVRMPSGRVHDFGGLVLLSGRQHSFSSDSTAATLRRALEEYEGG